jgi:hypothetical protein
MTVPVNRRTVAVLGLAAVVALTATGCSTRRIDPDTTGSIPIEGTSWMRFCDGPNAVIWVPGRSGDADEVEAYVYDHHACAPNYYGENTPSPAPDRPADEDGINEDED